MVSQKEGKGNKGVPTFVGNFVRENLLAIAEKGILALPVIGIIFVANKARVVVSLFSVNGCLTFEALLPIALNFTVLVSGVYSLIFMNYSSIKRRFSEHYHPENISGTSKS